MTTTHYRAWRFVHPEFDTAESYNEDNKNKRNDQFGIRISNIGGIEMVDGHASVRQAVLLLLTTRPGERLMRPNYGCDLHSLIFSPNDASTHGLAIHYVKQALQLFEPRIQILTLDANSNNADPGRMDINLEYRVIKTARTDTIDFSMQLNEQELQ